MNNYLVTGCAGFIASVVAARLLQEGHRVVGVDNLNDYYDVRLKEYRLDGLRERKEFHFIRADIEEKEAVEKIFSESGPFQAVVNLAARAGVRASLLDPERYLATNITGTLNLLELCKQTDVKKFVLASTSSLYAGQKMPFREDLPVNTPISPYAASKKGAEVLAYTYHYLFGIDVSVVRYFTVYGPAGRPDMSIFRFIKWISEGEPILLYGDGTQSRDFTYVDDIARGTIAALRPLGYEVINLGSDGPYSLNDVIGQIEDMTGNKATIQYRDFQRTDITATWADIQKAKTLLDWRPQITLPEGLKCSIDWYRQNREWVRNVMVEE